MYACLVFFSATPQHNYDLGSYVAIINYFRFGNLQQINYSRGGSRVFVEEGFDLRLSGLCVQISRLSKQPSYSSQSE